jgi:UDP-glucose 4-epimerase
MGYKVIGIDSFSDYYSIRVKWSNLSVLKKNRNFKLIEGDLNDIDLIKLLKGIELVFHLAAQPGVRASWGSSFSYYVKDNITATQRLLEAAKERLPKRLIFASSSSVYGDSERLPTSEESLPRPVSPYGATKLAAENLCNVYFRNFNLPSVVLRYFTVYGPRQRPDMGFHRFIRRISTNEEVVIYGDGTQSRDFTYVGDTVSATTAAMNANPGSTFNVGSGRSISLIDAISVIESLVGKKARLRYVERAQGDARATSADITSIKRELNYEPRTSLRDGLAKQKDWQLGSEL